MIGIDTNILVRYVTGDHPEQSRRARETFLTFDEKLVEKAAALGSEKVRRA